MKVFRRIILAFTFIWNHSLVKNERLSAIYRYIRFHFRYRKGQECVIPFLEYSLLIKKGEGSQAYYYTYLIDFEEMLFNIKIAEDAPSITGATYVTNNHENKRREGRRHEFFDWPQIHPRRLGHVVVFTSDLKRKSNLFETALGFAVSDRVGPFMDFHRFL